jgi:hypothetical protein
MYRAIWRGVGAADRAGFENQCALTGTGGSNPPLSGFFMSFHKRDENPQLCRTLGQAGLKSVVEKFAPDTMVNTIEQVYQKLLEEK